MKTNWEKLRATVKGMDKDILKKAIEVDGHTIYKPEKFLEAGLSADMVKAFTKYHQSGEHPKSRINVNGKEVEALAGVYGLEILQFIANCFEVDSWKMGRGSRAEHLREQLIQKWS